MFPLIYLSSPSSSSPSSSSLTIVVTAVEPQVVVITGRLEVTNKEEYF